MPDRMPEDMSETIPERMLAAAISQRSFPVPRSFSSLPPFSVSGPPGLIRKFLVPVGTAGLRQNLPSPVAAAWPQRGSLAGGAGPQQADRI